MTGAGMTSALFVACVVAHQEAGEFAVLHDRQGEAAVAKLQLRGQAIDEQRRVVDRVTRDFRRGHRAAA